MVPSSSNVFSSFSILSLMAQGTGLFLQYLELAFPSIRIFALVVLNVPRPFSNTSGHFFNISLSFGIIGGWVAGILIYPLGCWWLLKILVANSVISSLANSSLANLESSLPQQWPIWSLSECCIPLELELPQPHLYMYANSHRLVVSLVLISTFVENSVRLSPLRMPLYLSISISTSLSSNFMLMR